MACKSNKAVKGTDYYSYFKNWQMLKHVRNSTLVWPHSLLYMAILIAVKSGIEAGLAMQD